MKCNILLNEASDNRGPSLASESSFICIGDSFGLYRDVLGIHPISLKPSLSSSVMETSGWFTESRRSFQRRSPFFELMAATWGSKELFMCSSSAESSLALSRMDLMFFHQICLVKTFQCLCSVICPSPYLHIKRSRMRNSYKTSQVVLWR